MWFLAVWEFVIAVFFVLFVVTQIINPILNGKRCFSWFRKPKQPKQKEKQNEKEQHCVTGGSGRASGSGSMDEQKSGRKPGGKRRDGDSVTHKR